MVHHLHDWVDQLVGCLSSEKLDTDLNISERDLADFLNIIRETLNHEWEKLGKVLDEVIIAGRQEDHDTAIRLSNVWLGLLRFHHYQLDGFFIELYSMHRDNLGEALSCSTSLGRMKLLLVQY
jgi:hypothetical protein